MNQSRHDHRFTRPRVPQVQHPGLSMTPDPNAPYPGESAEHAQQFRDYRHHSRMLGQIAGEVSEFCRDSEDTTYEAVLALKKKYRAARFWAWVCFLLLLVVFVLLSAPPVPERAARDPVDHAFRVTAPAELRSTVASWYGATGRPTASGEAYDPAAHTAAHPWLPFGTRVSVFSGDRVVEVRVNDRTGPAARERGRELDLSPAAFARLAPLEAGVLEVDYVFSRSAVP